MNKYSDLNENARDILKEIGNIGTGNAVTALARMIGCPIKMELPQIRILGYNEAPELVGGAEDVQVGILLDASGDLNGMFLFLMNEKFTGLMIKYLLGGERHEIIGLNEMERSAVCEIGNIMCCSYLNAMTRLLNLSVAVSVPDACADMVGAILSVPMIHFANLSDELLFIENKYNLNDEELVSYVLFLPEIESLERIFKALGESYEE